MAIAIAYRAGSNLKGLSLTDWDVLRIDRHAKKVIVTVVVAYLTFLCHGTYIWRFLPLEELRLWALRLKNPTTPSGERIIPSGGLCFLHGERALPAFPRN
jgi:hypothetical protein